MKKRLAAISTILVLSMLLSSCGQPAGGKKKKPFDDDTSSSVPIPTPVIPMGKPSHDLSKVDVKATYDDFYVEDFSKPWGSDKNLRLVNSDVDNYFVYVSLDAGNNMVNENLNYMSTVTKPTIQVYRNEDYPGCLIYEVNYEQIFPIYSRQPSSYYYSSFFSYHNVEFIDFYTGTVIPSVYLSTSIDSFGVTGNFIYKGEKYRLDYYEFRHSEVEKSERKTESSGTELLSETVKISSTSYFIVPEFYDGLLMCVYVANDTGRSVQELLEENSPDFCPPEPFGDDENPDDYVFFAITAPK
jgi:hypothetical protein